MSAERFISELERRSLLSDRVLAKLRESAAAPNRPLSAKALAKFLVQKKHLSQNQATEVLNGLLAGGLDLNATAPLENVRTKPARPAANQVTTGILLDEENETKSAGDSSIFGPFLTGRSKEPQNVVSARDADPGLVKLAPTDDIRGAKPSKPAAKTVEKDVSAGAVSLPQNAALQPAETLPVAAEIAGISEKAVGSPRLTTRLERRGKKAAKKSKPTKGKKQWDSPLILLGGGGLFLLLLSGATIWWLMNWESGDQKLQLAQTARNGGAYTQAIEHYRDFLESSPRHAQRSLARVELAMVLIRQATEAGNYAAALETAQQELQAVEDEEDFTEAHDELAALLPQIALGLANQAEQASVGSAEATQFAGLANRALALCNNVAYIPKTWRDEGKLTAVRETLQRVERHQETHRALSETLAKMEQAIADNKSGDAYLAHRKLLVDHPELFADAGLTAAIQKAIAAEQATIRFLSEEQAAETAERPVPWVAALAVANRRTAAAAAESTGTACIRVEGAIYGLEAATGRLLWRRQVGIGTALTPTRIDGDLLVADTAHQEIVRLDAATGQLRWRQTIGEPFTQPLVVKDRGFVASQSGRLFVIDLNSGVRLGFLQFAQPLRVMPTANSHQQRLYLAGEHSSLYSIALEDLSCAGVYYLGHAEGSIRVPLVLVLDKLAVLENDGVETSRLHLLSVDDRGTIAKQEADRRLTGSATSAPLVAGRRLFVVTDRGQMEAYDIGTGAGAESLSLVAARNPTGTQPVARHAAVVGNTIWLGDTQLTKFTILPTGNRLPVESIENNFSGAAFDHPLEQVGKALIHVRRPNGRAGVVVAATDLDQAKLLWETCLAMPPAGAPVVNSVGKTLSVANAEGDVFRFDEAAIRSRVQDQPVAAMARPANLPVLTTSVDLGAGRAAFCAAGADQLLLYDPAQSGRPLQWIKLESPLACPVTTLGEGIIAPLKVGQVFFLSATDGSSLATPFQPQLAPRTTIDYQPAGVVDAVAKKFVISDGRDKIYLVAHADQPSLHLQKIAEATAGPYPVQSQFIVLGDMALAVAGESHVARFRLPSLEHAGDLSLPAPVVCGPFAGGNAVLLATADQQLVLVSPAGEIVWQVPLEHGDLAGTPLVRGDSVLIAFRNGIVERRGLSDGKPLASVDIEHSLAAGPVGFLQHVVVAANDGTLLVLNQP